MLALNLFISEYYGLFIVRGLALVISIKGDFTFFDLLGYSAMIRESKGFLAATNI
jgi:hypothetical protein|tara:strand:- start:509 stop:673 length:165 start_codon:yes stop_codon:yes gene_type:complete